jgi:exopolyphosphatase/guanosine-5'-triphosphate,3'-diphosphate pyrophosphatase
LKERIGIIDLGTNTFNLLIVDRHADGFERVYSTKEGVGLGLGGINDGFIAQPAMVRGLETLETFMNKAKELGCLKVKAFATSAIRDADNGVEFVLLLKDKLDLTVEVISGAREAELIYQGVKLGYEFEENALIMDIGGGSTEFIYATKSGVKKSHSFNIGTARIYQMFDFEDPYSQEDIKKVIDYLEDNTKGYFDDIHSDILIGASGSFETFYSLLNERDYPEDNFEDMKANALIHILDEMITSTYQERMKNQFIIPIRKKMAPIAAIKIKWILEKLEIKTLTISPFAMKEGVIQLI